MSDEHRDRCNQAISVAYELMVEADATGAVPHMLIVPGFVYEDMCVEFDDSDSLKIVEAPFESLEMVLITADATSYRNGELVFH